MLMQQAPVRNESVVGAQVYSHSGEYSPRVVEFGLPGRSVSFEFARKYRSSHNDQIGPLGRGWTFAYAKRLDLADRGVLYSDGLGRTHLFRRAVGDDTFISPDGFYAVLDPEGDRLVLRQQYGHSFVFEAPNAGGRLLSIRDRNNNSLEFDYVFDAIRVRDTLNRIVTIVLAQDRVVELHDHTDRVWSYEYDQDGCLKAVVQPPPEVGSESPRIRYEYDDAFRLISVTNPNGQTFLRNFYDDAGRMRRQEHGNGFYQFEYETIGEAENGGEGANGGGSSGGGNGNNGANGNGNGTALPIYMTRATLKNGARLLLTHNATGHVVERTMLVSPESVAEELHGRDQDAKVALTTTSEYNRHGEVVQRTFPAGNSLRWEYEADHADPRARGNLLRSIAIPAEGVESDQELIVTSFTYDPAFQRRRSITNPRGHTIEFEYDHRGNLTRKVYPEVTVPDLANGGPGARATTNRRLSERFDYNAGGQVIRIVDARGAVTEYHYYAPDEQVGANVRENTRSDAGSLGGLLARILHYPAIDGTANQPPVVQELGYDPYSNITTARDGNGNATRLAYNAHGRLIRTSAPDPFNYAVDVRYDANGNPIESSITFDRQELDGEGNGVVETASTFTQRLEYNILNNIVRRTIIGDDREITEAFERDANENIVRIVQPLGTIFEYRFDERNLLLERRLGVGTSEEATVRHVYTPNGRRHSRTDGRNHTLSYHYDGYHRYRGFTNPEGTTKTQWFDEVGNVVRVRVTGDAGIVDEQGEPAEAAEAVLLDTQMQYDELNRRVRVDRAWRNVVSGEAMGQSNWDDAEGMVSIVTEYGDNHLPARVWDEMGNIVAYEYDGLNRMVSTRDSSGAMITLEYDANNNPVRVERLGPDVDDPDERLHEIMDNRFDQLNRLRERSVNYEPPDTLLYNALGAVLRYTDRSGRTVQYLHDEFGRGVGLAATVELPSSAEDAPQRQLIAHQVELDDNNRVVARINAVGVRTQYRYDALSRRSGVDYPDGTTKRFERDGRGNIVRITDQSQNVVSHQFDGLNRLITRQVMGVGADAPQIELYRYDGVNRLVAARANGISTLRRYDTLSRRLAETQNGRTLSYNYDQAGNLLRVAYPGGQVVEKSYDMLRRVVAVRDEAGVIAEYSYRAGRRLNSLRLGGVLQATFTYRACQGCLSELAYRSLADGTLVAGSRYLYDEAGNRTAEIQLHRGETFGERYTYDSINRLVGVQYGVADVHAPDSPFEREEQFELDPSGTWQRRIVQASAGRTIEQLDGAFDERGGLTSPPRQQFEYDANGNRTRAIGGAAGCADQGSTYDYANRPTHVESLDANGAVVGTVDYTYDAFGRQVEKRVADGDEVRQTERVWSGCQLVEEWVDGNLSRRYEYGAATNQPVKMTRNTPGGPEQFYYIYDGRGQVIALATSEGTVAERYSYDGWGNPALENAHVGSIAARRDREGLVPSLGVVEEGTHALPVEPEDEAFASFLGNMGEGPRPVASAVGNPMMGCGLWDQDTCLTFGHGGSAYDPATGQLTNPESRKSEPDCGNDCPGRVDPNSQPPGFDPMAASGSGDGMSWGKIGVGLALIGLGITIAATGGLASVPIAVIAGAGTAGEIVVAATAIGLAGTGGGIIGSELGSSGSGSSGSGSSGSGSSGSGSSGSGSSGTDGKGGGGGGGGGTCGGSGGSMETTDGGSGTGGEPGSAGGGPTSGGGTTGGSGSGGSSGGTGAGSGSGSTGGTSGTGSDGGGKGEGGSEGGQKPTGGNGGETGEGGGGNGCGEVAESPGGQGFTPGDSSGGCGLTMDSVLNTFLNGGCGGGAAGSGNLGLGGLGGGPSTNWSGAGGCSGGVDLLGGGTLNCGAVHYAPPDVIGGTNPIPEIPEFGHIDYANPADDYGAMGGYPTKDIIPGGGYTDPAEELVCDTDCGAYTPKNQMWTTSTPEGSGGSCGIGRGSPTLFPDCTIA